jgi:glutaredoxin
MAYMRTVTLIGKPGCHLCDDARAALQRLSAQHGFEIHEVDIETDDALHAAYLERIPVICLDGEHVSDYFLDEPTLTARLNSDG